MMLKWNPDNGRSWNLGTISKHGLLVPDHLGGQANSEGLLDLHKEYLKKLAALVPGAYVKKTPKETGWYVTENGKQYIAADALLANETRKDGWICAIADFQSAVKEKSNDN